MISFPALTDSMIDRPLAIDLFCGLGGWSEGLLAEGYDVIGFDIERHEYAVPDIDRNDDGSKGTRPVAKRGWTQGCAISLGMEGANKRPATRILRYPAQLVLQDVLTLHGSQFRDAALIVASPPCQEYSYMAMPWKLAKAKAAAIRADTTGAELARLNRLFDACFRIQKEACFAAGRHIPMVVENVRGAQAWVGRARWNYGSFYLWGDVPALMPPVSKGVKVGGFSWSDYGKPGYEPKAFNGEAARKNTGGSWFNVAHNTTSGKGNNPDGRKGGGDWFGSGENCSLQRSVASRSPKRKAASAMIAKIPLPLSRHIASAYFPRKVA